MSRNNSQLNRQNELIRSLRKQLEATERELANQKWVFEQFLRSPAWRITYPIRWVARQLRAVKKWVADEPEPLSATNIPENPDLIEEDIEPPADAKEFLTSLFRTQLHSFLNSNALLQLPHSDSPEVSVLVVLFNRAELTLACLRSIAETYSERIEIIIVDNASSDETPLLLERLRGPRILRNAENRNFLLSVNQAAREARGEYLLVMNNDAHPLHSQPYCNATADACRASGYERHSAFKFHHASYQESRVTKKRRLTTKNTKFTKFLLLYSLRELRVLRG